MWAAINVLKSDRHISDLTNRLHKQLEFFDINIKIAYKCCRAALSSLFSTLSRWFPNGALKQEFYAIEVTTFFGNNNVKHIEATKMIFFSKYSKFYVDSENAINFFKNNNGF